MSEAELERLLEACNDAGMMDSILNMDCSEGLDLVPDGSVDMVLMDPPYKMGTQGAGAFGNANRRYFDELGKMSDGLSDALLEKIASKMKRIVMYAFCSKSQILQYIRFAESHGCTWDILAWHKTNPVPTCSNKYLSDTEYIVFIRGKGVTLYGSYATKKKWWATGVNRADRELYGHPTVKPLDIVRTLIGNHIGPDGGGRFTVLDPFIGTGTTAVACVQLGVHYIGFEVDPGYHATALKRVSEARPLKSSLESFDPFVRQEVSRRPFSLHSVSTYCGP